MSKKQFRKYKQKLIDQYEEGGESQISWYCALCHIPVIIAYELLNEEYDGKFDEKLRKLREFYG